MIHVTRTIAINENEIREDFIRASGPGGQNVNKVASAVQLRFDVANSPSVLNEVRESLFALARRRITKEGVLVINARRFRTQGANRQDAMERLMELIRKADEKPQIRRKTRPTLASKMLRLEDKHRSAQTKRLRSPIQKVTDG